MVHLKFVPSLHAIDDPVTFSNPTSSQYTWEMISVGTERIRPKQGLAETEWAAHQSEITRLYISEDGSLESIMSEMRTKHSFRAT